MYARWEINVCISMSITIVYRTHLTIDIQKVLSDTYTRHTVHICDIENDILGGKKRRENQTPKFFLIYKTNIINSQRGTGSNRIAYMKALITRIKPQIITGTQTWALATICTTTRQCIVDKQWSLVTLS